MIVEGVVDFFLRMLTLAFQGFEIVGLPYQFINVLSTLTSYGIWIVGIDVMSIIVTSIIAWWVAKLAVGLFLLILEIIPF